MGLIKAMKGNLVGYFAEHAWEIGKSEMRGWRKIGVASGAVMVESEQIDLAKTEIEVTEIPDDDVVVEKVEKPVTTKRAEIETTDDDLYPTEDEMRAELTEKGVRVHPNLGLAKLKKLYDENSK